MEMPTCSRSGRRPGRAFGLSGWLAWVRGQDLGGQWGLASRIMVPKHIISSVPSSGVTVGRDGGPAPRLHQRIRLCASASAVISEHGPDAPPEWSAGNISGGKFGCLQASRRWSFSSSSRTRSAATRAASCRACSASSRAYRSANRPCHSSLAMRGILAKCIMALPVSGSCHCNCPRSQRRYSSNTSL